MHDNTYLLRQGTPALLSTWPCHEHKMLCLARCRSTLGNFAGSFGTMAEQCITGINSDTIASDERRLAKWDPPGWPDSASRSRFTRHNDVGDNGSRYISLKGSAGAQLIRRSSITIAGAERRLAKNSVSIPPEWFLEARHQQ